MNRCLAALMALLLLAAAARAENGREYFVAPDGDDNNPGTIEEPKRCPIEAAKLLQPGDSLVFRGGEYRARANRTYSLAPYRDGEPDAPITFRNHEDEHVTLDLSGSSWGLSNNGYSYIIFDGFEITGDVRNGMKLAAGSGRRTEDGELVYGRHVTVRNCEVHGAASANIFAIGTEYLTIENCHLHSSQRSHGLYIQRGCHNVVVRNVTSENNHGNSGMQLNASKGGVRNALVERNILRNNAQGFSLMGNKNSIFRHNILYNNGYPGPRGGSNREIILWTPDDTTCRQNIFENNTVVNTQPEGHRVTRLVIMKSETRNTTFRNNIFYIARQRPTFAIEADSLAGHLIESNCFYGGPMATPVGDLDELAEQTTTLARDNIFADPGFVDVENGDLRLREDSPCVGASTDGGDLGAIPRNRDVHIGCRLPWRDGE